MKRLQVTRIPGWILGLCLAPVASAGTFTIHPTPGEGDFTSPAAALASPLVTDGDRLEVAPDVYGGTLLVDKAVHLVATGGPADTVLYGAWAGTLLEISAPATVEGFRILGGGGPVSVGGVKITSAATVTLVGNVIEMCHAESDVGVPVGGVFIADGASAVLRGNDIRSNTALSVGGVLAGPGSTFEMVGNKIRGNGGMDYNGHTTAIGGLLLGGSGRLVNEQITGNLGSGIGGLYWAGGLPFPAGAELDVINCTIYGNVGSSPLGSVGGVFLDDGGAVAITNTLIFGNIGSEGADILPSSDFFMPPVMGSLVLSYSLVGAPGPGVPLGPGVILSVHPSLVAPTGATSEPTILGDFHPRPGSPLVHAGLDYAFPFDLEPLDHDGLDRFTGPAIDMGAFEFQRAHRHLRQAAFDRTGLSLGP
jgi:hypothetical protein